MITALSCALVLVAGLLAVICTATLRWMLHAWRSPEAYAATHFPFADSPQLSFSVIVPCRDEQLEVMEATLARLMTQSHPRVEVIVSVGHDDADTRMSAELLAARYPGRIRVSVNHDAVKNKARQLNTALAECRHEIVGVMDAESLAAPDLLARVDTTFRVDDADAVQGAVHLVNLHSRWFTLRNCLEYRIWFRSRLHSHARAGFIPLGGNTVFVRRALLERIGGWDGDCLAEDCDLGVRLSVLDARVVCVYSSDLVTREEAPITIASFVKQRTRWSLGFMQVLAKDDWRRLPAHRRLGAWWTLVQQHAMALAGVLVPFGFATAVLLKVATGIAMLTYLPVIPLLLTVGFEVLVLHDFGRDMHIRVRVRDYVLLVVSTPFYAALLLYCCAAAAVKFARRDFRWHVTPHAGTHLTITLPQTAVSGPAGSQQAPGTRTVSAR